LDSPRIAVHLVVLGLLCHVEGGLVVCARERQLYGHSQVGGILSDDRYSKVDCSIVRSDGSGRRSGGSKGLGSDRMKVGCDSLVLQSDSA
jgi:hypothetical protein